MGLLLYIFIALIIIGIALITSLFACNNRKTERISFILFFVFSIWLTFIGFDSLPSNYIGQKIIFVFWGLLNLLAFYIYIKFPHKAIQAKYMLTGCLILEYLSLIFL